MIRYNCNTWCWHVVSARPEMDFFFRDGYRPVLRSLAITWRLRRRAPPHRASGSFLRFRCVRRVHFPFLDAFNSL